MAQRRWYEGWDWRAGVEFDPIEQAMESIDLFDRLLGRPRWEQPFAPKYLKDNCIDAFGPGYAPW